MNTFYKLQSSVKIGLCIGVFLASSAQPAFAAESFDSVLAPEPRAEACNGGSCESGGSVFNCPTNGGPTCVEGQACICECGTMDGGAVFTTNSCKDSKPRSSEESLNQILGVPQEWNGKK